MKYSSKELKLGWSKWAFFLCAYLGNTILYKPIFCSLSFLIKTFCISEKIKHHQNKRVSYFKFIQWIRIIVKGDSNRNKKVVVDLHWWFLSLKNHPLCISITLILKEWKCWLWKKEKAKIITVNIFWYFICIEIHIEDCSTNTLKRFLWNRVML